MISLTLVLSTISTTEIIANGSDITKNMGYIVCGIILGDHDFVDCWKNGWSKWRNLLETIIQQMLLYYVY